MNGPALLAFALVGMFATFVSALVLALAAGVWVWNQTRQNEPVPYYPADGLQRLADAIHDETPLFDQVLEEADFKAWAEQMGGSDHR